MSEAGGRDDITPARGSAIAAHAAMLLFSLFVSSSFTVGAVITDALDPAALTFLRVLLAAIFFGIVVLVGGRGRWPTLGECGQCLVLGALVVTFFVAMFEALRLTTALSTGALFCSIPLMTAIISFVGLRQRLDTRQVISLALAAAGAVWVVFDGSLARLATFRLGTGEMIFLVGCLSYSAYSPAIRYFDAGAPALLISFWTILAGAMCLAIYGHAAILEAQWHAVPWTVYAGITHLALFTTAISFFLVQFASTRLPQARVMAYLYLVPVFIVLTEGLVHGLWPDASVLAGVGIITAAMIVLQAGSVPAGPALTSRAEDASHRG